MSGTIAAFDLNTSMKNIGSEIMNSVKMKIAAMIKNCPALILNSYAPAAFTSQLMVWVVPFEFLPDTLR